MFEKMGDFAKRKRELKGQTNKLFIILILNMILSLFLGSELSNYGLFLVEIFLNFVQIEEIYINLIIMSAQLISTFGPAAISLLCGIKMLETNKENEKIRLEEAKYLSMQIFEENKPKVDEILEEGEKISRKELMDLLNMTKTELMKRENIKNKKVVGPDELLLAYFQKELEDILFPSVNEEDKGRSRTRKK